MSQQYSYQDVAEHNTKKDLFVVIHDKVYDCSKFVDEHPYVLQFPTPATSCWIPLFFFSEGGNSANVAWKCHLFLFFLLTPVS